MINAAFFGAAFLLIAAFLLLIVFDKEHGSVWAYYPISFFISFAHAYEYHRRHTEKKDLLSPPAAKVGTCAGVLAIATLAAFFHFFDSDAGILSEEGLLSGFNPLIGYCFFAMFGVFISFCAMMVKK